MNQPTVRPLVLLSNDDGHASRGLEAFREALAAHFDVVSVAPEHEQSASSHALSLRKPLRLRKVADHQFALDGTPADCVYVALHGGTRVLPRSPDVVVSGINLGLNLGQDVFYSGTVAAAREAALRGIPSIAASTHVSLDLAKVALACTRVALALPRARQARTPLLSLNFPKGWDGRMRATRLGTRIYEERVEFRKDPYHNDYLWLGGPGVRHEADPGTDTDAYDEGVASITPLVLDLTSYADATLAESLARAVGEAQAQ
jgi:5'-nucleotidase